MYLFYPRHQTTYINVSFESDTGSKNGLEPGSTETVPRYSTTLLYSEIVDLSRLTRESTHFFWLTPFSGELADAAGVLARQPAAGDDHGRGRGGPPLLLGPGRRFNRNNFGLRFGSKKRTEIPF